MLEYKMRSEEERVEELQNGIKSLAKYSDKEDLTPYFLQRRMEEVTYLGLDNLDEAVGQMLLEKLEKIYNYPELNSNIKALKMLLKEYYL